MADPNVIPFAEGAPADDLMVETLPDGDVLIGDPELDDIEESDSGFGLMRATRHAARLEATPPRWDLPAMPLGSHAPVWQGGD